MNNVSKFLQEYKEHMNKAPKGPSLVVQATLQQTSSESGYFQRNETEVEFWFDREGSLMISYTDFGGTKLAQELLQYKDFKGYRFTQKEIEVVSYDAERPFLFFNHEVLLDIQNWFNENTKED
jgi:hypothetical protein